MLQTATNIRAGIQPMRRTSRLRPWIALATAAIAFALGVFGLLPFIFAVPVVGVVLALGSP
jgi:hypothetical protein